MSIRTLLLAFVVSSVALAGCATNDGNDAGGDQGTTTTTTTTPATTTPATTTPAPGGDVLSIKVGTEAAYPPFEDTVDGEIVGFDIDVMREIANRSGMSVTFQNAEFQAIIPSIQSGQFDAGISAFTITEERQAQVDFSVSYYDNELMVAVLSANDDIQAEGDLEGKRVCTQTGTTSETWLRENAGATNDSLMLLPSFPACAEALKRGDVDAIMIDRAAVRDLIAKSNGELKDSFTVPTEEQFGIAVKKGNAVLLTRINTALVAMKQDGTLDKLKDKWSV